MSSRRPRRLLVVDDEPAARRGIVRALGRERYSFVEEGDGHAALSALDTSPFDLVLLDLRMPGLDGRATLERILEMSHPPPVVVVTADASLRTAVDAVRAGAADFLAKPYEIEELRWVVERSLASAHLKRENHHLRAEVERLGGGGEILGSSPAMVALIDAIERVAPSAASVLVRGETGTGKELVARRIHDLSTVAGGPFIALNCAAVPETLLESELFGHAKGAFTGAERERVGRFREAHGGTLFLDEIGDMPAAAQAKLLRVLQDGLVEPLGGGKASHVEVRVLAATHRDLEALCADGAFRQDLYYRLRVVELELPPLRERGHDVLELARAFLATAGCRNAELAPESAAALLAHPWPGNVRELRNAMERAAIFHGGDLVCPEDLPAEIKRAAVVAVGDVPEGVAAVGDTAAGDTAAGNMDVAADEAVEGDLLRHDLQSAKAMVVERFERLYLDTVLRRTGGNISAAAREAGVHRQNLQKKLRHLAIDPERYRGHDAS